MTVAFVGLGSNMGDRRLNISRAVKLISGRCRVLAVSRIYETEPMYVTDQPKFFNAAIRIRTEMNPAALLAFLNRIEKGLGRNRAKERRFGKRTIDLDILFFGNVRLKSRRLVIPHPRLRERAFVLIPLYEVRRSTEIRRLIKALPEKEIEGIRRTNAVL